MIVDEVKKPKINLSYSEIQRIIESGVNKGVIIESETPKKKTDKNKKDNNIYFEGLK